MKRNSEFISHPGIVEQCTDARVRVRILSASACSSCQAKGSCSMSEMEEKLIDVPHKDTAQFKPGQEVTLVMEARIGWIAVLLAYILPFVLLILTLIAVYALTNDQGLAGLSALGILVPYYVLLYGYRHRLHLNSGFRII